MAVLTYRNMTLEIIETRGILREEVLTDDQTTFLYLKWTIDVNCVYNPAATSFTPDMVKQAGFQPPETDAAIRNFLMQPQGKLRLNDEDGRVILKCPGDGYTTDCKNGPTPMLCEVVRIHGTKTWMVHFKIVAYVNECLGPNRSPKLNILLSHRWKRYVDIDQDYFSTIITEGEAIFRADELIKLGFFPDQFRGQLFHAVPNNFKRDHIQVTPSEDGTRVNYRVTDTEMAFNGPGLPSATRIEAYQTGTFGEPNNIAESQAAFVAAAHEAMAGASLDPVATLAHAAAAGGRMMFNQAMRLLPSYSMHVICRVWGNRESNRRNLMNLAIGVCTSRMRPANNGIVSRASETIISQDLTGKFAECQMTARWGPEQIALGALSVLINNVSAIGQAFGIAAPVGIVAPVMGGFGSIIDYFPVDETITVPPIGPRDARLVTSSTLQLTNPPPYSDQSRGTWIGQLVAQALSQPCSLPADPPDYPDANKTVIDVTTPPYVSHLPVISPGTIVS